MKTYIEERLKRAKSNALVDIRCYENGAKAVNRRRRLMDIWARMRYERNKLIVKAIDENKLELYEKLTDWDNLCINRIPKFRILAVIGASHGRTMLETELTDDEIIQARKIANEKVDEWLNEFKDEAV